MMQGKGGTQQQQTQSVFGDYGPQSTQEQAIVADIDTGSGYYRNPYSSGYGMGYQDPYAGMRYMPQRGLMGGPSGFGGKGGYSQPMSSPYGYSQPMYSPYQYSPYGGMSPGAKDDRLMDRLTAIELGLMPPPVTPVEMPMVGSSLAGDTRPPLLSSSLAGVGLVNATPEQLTASADPLYSDVMEGVPVTNTMDIADADPTRTMPVGTMDESSIADFTPYAGEELVRIGDQVVSRAELQRRGSDYYTRPIQEPPMQMYPMMRRQQYPMYGGKGGYYR